MSDADVAQPSGTASAAELRQRGHRDHLAHLARAARPARSRATTLVVDAPDDASAVGRRALRPPAAAPAPPPCSGPGAQVEARRRPPAAAAPRRPRERQPRRAVRAARSTRASPSTSSSSATRNRLAHGAALAVAELPGLAYNPLFICGPPGLGKTHLLHSIANYVHRARRRPDRPLHDGRGASPTTSSARCTAATSRRFKARYRGVDVLLVDDVQFLAEQGQDRGGVLPHLQRAARGRRASSS